jgi:hypothetical protein
MLAEGLGDWEDWAIAAFLLVIAWVFAYSLAKIIRWWEKRKKTDQEPPNPIPKPKHRLDVDPAIYQIYPPEVVEQMIKTAETGKMVRGDKKEDGTWEFKRDD